MVSHRVLFTQFVFRNGRPRILACFLRCQAQTEGSSLSTHILYYVLEGIFHFCLASTTLSFTLALKFASLPLLAKMGTNVSLSQSVTGSTSCREEVSVTSPLITLLSTSFNYCKTLIPNSKFQFNAHKVL